MNADRLFTDTKRRCPDCGSRGSLTFVEVPESKREYTDAEGTTFVDHFGTTRDYWCNNCDCEFVLTDWQNFA